MASMIMRPTNKTHPALDHSRHQVRLLSFRPLGKYVLRTFNFHEAPRYLALSYVWGHTHEMNSINLNGKDFTVRENLATCLEAIRSHMERATPLATLPSEEATFGKEVPLYWDTYFWIDAICIDQLDDAEKTHQVNLMDYIYSSASATLVWLGKQCTGIPSMLSCRRPPSRSVEVLCQNEFWTRTWVIQEVVLAKQILILSSDGITPLTKLMSSIGWMLRCKLSREAHNILNARAALHKEEQYSMWGAAGASSRTLVAMLMRYANHNCSDPRDTVYALISLIDWRGKLPLVADYSMSCRALCSRLETYYNVAHDWIPNKLREAASLEQLLLHNVRTRLSEIDPDHVFRVRKLASQLPFPHSRGPSASGSTSQLTAALTKSLTEQFKDIIQDKKQEQT